MRFPFGSLPENLAAFCAVLRRDHRFRIGPRELTDAARAIEIAGIADERAVRDVLRAVLSKSLDDVLVFDRAFHCFFRGMHGALPPYGARGRPATHPADDRGASSSTPPSPRAVNGIAKESESSGLAVGDVRDVADSERETAATLLRASYSPVDGEGTPLVLEPPTRAWIDAAAVLAASVRVGASRRWRPAVRGPRFDFRRTLRTSLHTGGVPLTPRWRARPRRRSRFVLLVDGSRSMGVAARPALQTAVALSAVSAMTETFAFTTALRRVTRDVRRAAAGARRTVAVQQAWGGGTTIGACLDQFLLHFGDRLLGRATVVLIASDGLDVGNPDLLRHAMSRLARRCAAVVWINPLLDTRGYEPTAGGMRLARPYVTRLTSIRDAASLRPLARALSGVRP
jgi:uncharacterized protein with von Willebrand factor type A (vWA) domain